MPPFLNELRIKGSKVAVQPENSLIHKIVNLLGHIHLQVS